MAGLFFLLCFFISLKFTGLKKIKIRQIYLFVVSLLYLYFPYYLLRMDDWEKTVSNPIRVDLVLFVPILLILYIIGMGIIIYSIVQKIKNN